MSSPIDPSAEGSPFDRLWSVATLYKNQENPILQEFATQGQLQVQYATGTGDSGDFSTADRADACTWGDVEVRRFRFGMRALMFHSIKIHTLWDLYPDLTPRIYQRTPEAYVSYMPCDAFNLSVGKVELKFTREQEISSRDYLTFERSQLVSQFYSGELTGAWVSGKNIAGGWLYELGAYSNERRDEWPEFEGGTMIFGKLGFNYSVESGLDMALAELQYLHNSEPGYQSPGDPKSPPYSDCVAISNSITEGRFGLQTEAMWGNGKLDKPNAWGVSVLPSWFLTEKLQCVGLFEYAASAEANGIYLPTRYEACAPQTGDKSGDSYFSAYAGLNYYFYGHKLKVMSGMKYSHLDGKDGGGNFSSWTWLAGIRMAF